MLSRWRVGIRRNLFFVAEGVLDPGSGLKGIEVADAAVGVDVLAGDDFEREFAAEVDIDAAGELKGGLVFDGAGVADAGVAAEGLHKGIDAVLFPAELEGRAEQKDVLVEGGAAIGAPKAFMAESEADALGHVPVKCAVPAIGVSEAVALVV